MLETHLRLPAQWASAGTGEDLACRCWTPSLFQTAQPCQRLCPFSRAVQRDWLSVPLASVRATASSMMGFLIPRPQLWACVVRALAPGKQRS